MLVGSLIVWNRSAYSAPTCPIMVICKTTVRAFMAETEETESILSHKHSKLSARLVLAPPPCNVSRPCPIPPLSNPRNDPVVTSTQPSSGHSSIRRHNQHQADRMPPIISGAYLVSIYP